MQSKKVILSSAYFPPVQYFSKILLNENIYIEAFENYSKQSYRNRCEILSPNGKLTLSVPVIKKTGIKQAIRDVKIDYKNDWQSLHLKSIKTAYLSSPFYEYYMDAFIKYFEDRYTYLFDLNYELLITLINELQIKVNLSQTYIYTKDYSCEDCRNSIHPKEKFSLSDLGFIPKKYTQVFFEKFDFVPNLSILDLLFNEGPNSENIISLSV